ncbi:MAG: beta-lactamase domain protein [Actinomycetia bacterium]|nr:beta-lactamase domain protein [Actinomycetes bacterium]
MDQPYRVGTDVHVLPSQLPVPGVGVIPIHAFVLMSRQPVLIDCGLGIDADAFVDALRSVIDPADLAWIWLTHDDSDHTGSLQRILELAPQARLVTHGLGALRMNTSWAVPLDRVMAVAPGDRLDVGDRMLRATRPPTYDNPMSTGIFDESTSTFFSVDSFGAILPSSPRHLEELSDEELAGGMTAWATFDSPWLHLADPERLSRVLDTVRGMGAERVLSSHLPPAIGRIDALLEIVAAIPDAEPFVAPDEAAFNAIAAGLAAVAAEA